MLSLIANLLFVHLSAGAAPHPATSTSFLIGKDSGRFISQHGFLLNSAATEWVHAPAPKDIASVETVYKAPDSETGVQAALTVRVDDLKEDLGLKNYIQQWLKDYHRLGFDILASQPVKVGNYKAYMLDLLHGESKKQLRQVIFVRRKKAVVLTCRDHKESFLTTLKSCNEIIRSFRWTL